MTTSQHPHAAFDAFPQLAEGLIREFGVEGSTGTIERIITAEKAEFYWEGRFAEINLGPWEGFDEEHIGCRRVRILGYFRGGYYVATCIADAESEIVAMFGERQFESLEAAEIAFLGAG